MFLAFLFAAAMTFPTVNPGGVFASLGVGSVAIGFAFKNILQNLPAAAATRSSSRASRAQSNTSKAARR